MISARERGLFQLLVGMQILIILALYGVCTFGILGIAYGQDVSIQAYGKYALVVLAAMVLEAVTRPGYLRLTTGRMRRIAWPIARRQWVWTLASLALLLVFSRDQRISRLFLACFSICLLLVLYLSNRYLMRVLGAAGLKHSKQWRLRTVVLGPKSWCDSVVPEIEEMWSALDLRQIQLTDDEEDYGIAGFVRWFEREPVDLLVMPAKHLPNLAVMDFLRLGDRMGFRCWMPLELSRAFGRRFELQRIGRLEVLTPPVEPLENTSNQFLKRLFDLMFAALVVVVVVPPLCLLVWGIHRRYSPGPLFFKQSRVGKNGMTFEVLKFRTLKVDHGDEARQVTAQDDRLFRGGRALRKSSLDEIPQFINVLRGEMSVVGPRPHMECHDSEFRKIFERYGVRRYVKPGVTGLAQVKGYRGEVRRSKDLRHRARLDSFYVTHWDLGMDLRIIAATAGTVIKPPRSAY